MMRDNHTETKQIERNIDEQDYISSGEESKEGKQKKSGRNKYNKR